MLNTSPVHFFFQDIRISLPERARLKQLIAGIFKTEKTRLRSINFIFVNDKDLLAINQQYLHHDYFTDIITFDLSEGDGTIGEVYISVDRVRDNARIQHTTIKEELHRVLFHGALHLCGYRDKKPAEQTRMRNRENFYLNKYWR